MKILSRYALMTALALFVCTIFAEQVIASGRSIVLTDFLQIAKDETNTSEATLKINVKADSKITVFELNNSQAARDLYAQLPMSTKVENYSDNEKIFYPPKKLDTADTPQANAKVGTLAYYAPWGDVVMFYGNFGSASGLYELGHAVSGSKYIKAMSGTIKIEKSP